MLFGPAYKGITLASATAVALADLGADVPFAFNRKEAKDHGEGGIIVGSALRGRVVIVDDVITDGAAKRESVELIRAHGATPVAVLIALDRVERAGTIDHLSSQSAVQAFEQEFGIPVISIANFGDLMQFLDSDSPHARDARAFRTAMEQYRAKYAA
jgi:orotate phosphoribosyltransferase